MGRPHFSIWNERHNQERNRETKKMKKDTERRKRDRERKRQEKKRKSNSLTSLRQDEGSQEAEKGDLLIPGAPLLRDRLRMGTELPKAHSLWPAMLRRAC